MKFSICFPRFAVLLSVFLVMILQSDKHAVAESKDDLIHPSATTGPFFRFQLMFHPLFDDGFDASVAIPSVKTRVFERMDIAKNERLKAIFESAGETPSEGEARLIVTRFKKAWSEIAEDAEAELRTCFDPQVYRKVLQTQLGMLGLRGLVDPEIAGLLNLDADQQEAIGKIFDEFPLRSFESDTVAADRAKRKAMNKAIAKKLLEKLPDDKLKNALVPEISSKATEPEATAERLLLPAELMRRKLVEYDQLLQEKLLPLLSADQKSTYQECVQVAEKMKQRIDMRALTSGN